MYNYATLSLKMTNPEGLHTILKTIPQVPQNLYNGITHGIDMNETIQLVNIIKNAIDYVNSYSEPNKFIFEIVDHQHDDIVYYTYCHETGSWK